MIHKKLILLAFPLALTAMDHPKIDQTDNAQAFPSLQSITFNKMAAHINTESFLNQVASNPACIPSLPNEAEQELATRLKSDEQGIIAKRLYGLSSKILKGFDNIWSAAWSPDGTKIALGSEDGTVHILNYKLNRILSTKKYCRAFSLDWSPDGTKIACGIDSKIKIWDLITDKIILERDANNNFIKVKWNPNSTMISIVGSREDVKIADIASSKLLVIGSHDNQATSANWSPDGSRIASSSFDKTLRIWDIASGQSQIFKGHTSVVYSTAWSPDGKKIASASNDQTVRIWDVTSGQSDILTDYASRILNVDWSPDGIMIASSSEDTIKICNTDSGKFIAVVPNKYCDDIKWCPDGTKIVYIMNDDKATAHILDWKRLAEIDKVRLSELLQLCSKSMNGHQPRMVEIDQAGLSGLLQPCSNPADNQSLNFHQPRMVETYCSVQ